MTDALRSLRLARHATHMRQVKEQTADAATSLVEAIAAVNELVAVAEGQGRDETE